VGLRYCEIYVYNGIWYDRRNMFFALLDFTVFLHIIKVCQCRNVGDIRQDRCHADA
jgi:hypothetical protein